MCMRKGRKREKKQEKGKKRESHAKSVSLTPKAWDLVSLAVGTFPFAVGTNQAQAFISNYGRRLRSRLLIEWWV